MVDLLHRFVYNDSYEGPINLVSPNPITQADFVQTLARVVNRKARITVPESIIKILYPVMAEETILAENAVLPLALQRSNYPFRYPDLASALTHILGRKPIDVS